MIKEFNLNIFHKHLWVSKKSTYTDIMKKFDICTLYDLENANLSEEEFDSFSSKFGMVTMGCIDKKTNKDGWLVLILTGNTVGDCSHEASHVISSMESYLGLEHDAGEYRAYLSGSITQCIYNTLIENIN